MTDQPDPPREHGVELDADGTRTRGRGVPRLSIRLLGGFAAEVGDVPLTGLTSGRVQELLAYLLLHRGMPQARRHLAFMFWPESNEAQAQTNLRTLLHRLRRAIPHSDRFLSANTHALLWREDTRMRLDVADFEAATAEKAGLSDLRRGVEMFRGELLPEVYDPWIDNERARLHQRLAQAAERACRMCEARRDYPGALELAQRLVRHDPIEEENYRRLMLLHALAGERTAALRVFSECADVLDRELGVSPEPATSELYDSLLAAGDPSDVVTTPRTPTFGTRLIGRFNEFERLQSAWRDALAGPARLVLIVGEPGIGKTRLAGELADWVERQGFAVARGRAYTTEGTLAYAPIVPWVREGLARVDSNRLDPLWLAELARLLPELTSGHPHLPTPPPITEPGESERFSEALVRGVLARSTPTLLLLDDIQWCAPETLGWLHYLLRTNADSPILVLATVRYTEGEDNPALARLIATLQREDRCDEVELSALSEADSELLAVAVSGGDAPPPAAIYRGAAGYPLFIVEMVRFHAAHPLTDTAPAVPPTVSGVIRARLAHLSDASLHLLRCAAVVGHGAPVSLVASVGELAGSHLARALDELQARGIAESRGQEQIEITHDLIRDQAYVDIGPRLRRHLHGAVAEALQGSARDPGALSVEIAAHLDRAGRPDEALRHYLDGASFCLHTGASDEALRLLRRALELADADGAAEATQRAVAVAIRERMADALYLRGRYADSRAVLEAGLECADSPLERARLSRRLGKASIGERRLEEALAALDEATRLLDVEAGTPDSRREWLQVQLDRMSVLYWLGDWRTMEDVDRAMTEVLAEYGSAEQRRQHDWQIVGMSLRRDRYVVSDGMVALARGILHSTMEDGYVPRIAVAAFHLAFVLLWHGDLAEARSEAQRALELADRTGDRNLELRCLTYLAVIGRLERQPGAVRALANRAEDLATAMGHRGYLGAARANQAWVAWRAGDRAGALGLGHAAIAAWETPARGSPAFMFEWLARLILIAVALKRRGAAPVAIAVGHARQLLDPSQQRLNDPIGSSFESAVREWEGGDPPTARALLREGIALAQDAKLI